MTIEDNGKRRMICIVCPKGCRLTAEPAGEHWFHTPEQLAAVDRWQRAALAELG